VLEDVHWADAMSVQVLHHLTRQPMPLIVTARAEELASNHAATLWLNELEASNTLTRLNLEPLNEKALAELSASFVTNDPDGLAARLYRSTRGNPLFAIETLRFALERGSTDALTLPPNLREAVLGRVKRLGGAVWRLLETASLAERGFRLEEVQSATALSEWEALEGLERAVGAGLLERIDLGLAFHHDLIRQALEDNLSPERRALIHRKLAETLEHQEAAPERVAHHLERAGLGAQAAIWRVRAARAAALLYAHREALEQYELALHHEVSADMRFEIVEATILLHYALGQAAQRQAAVEQLEQLGTRPEWRARALVARVMLEYDLGRYAQALKRAESLVEAEPSADQLEALLLYGSIARMRLGELDDAEAGLERGLNLAVQHRSKRINEFHLYRATVATYQGRYEDARRFNDAILRGEHTGDWVELDAVVNQGRFAVMLGDFEHGERCLRAALERARALQSDSMIRFALLGLSGTLNIRWAWREALPLVLENLELARQAQHKIVEIVMLDRLAQTRRLQGDLGAAFDALHLARAETAAAQASGSRAMIALSFAGLYLDVGDAARAQVELRDARSRAERENAVPYFAPIWTGLARAAWLEGDSVEAQECSVKARAFWDRSPASDRLESEHWWQLVHAVPISSVENLSWLPWRTRASMIALRTRGDAESTQNALGLLETSDLPPLEELELRRALRDLAPEVASATSFRARTRQIVQRLASSLESHPAHRKRFLTRHAGWLRD
jgi:tetratricopeptide (TPR) repeat protein